MTTRQLAAVAVVLALAACGGASATYAPASGVTSARVVPSGAQRLIYVLDGTYDLVDVLSYPQMRRKLRIGETFELGQMCTDGSHIWMPGGYANEIPEYDAGGWKPIAVLQDRGYVPNGCAYDATTGNLAVTNFFYYIGTQGNLLVYPHATGSPQSYTCDLFYYFYVTYDDKGNLYLDGVNATGTTQFCEMPKGQNGLGSLFVGESFGVPGGMAWDGKDVVVSNPQKKTLYRFTVKNGVAKKIRTTVLGGNGDCPLFWIDGATLICPNGTDGAIEYYRYPQGGAPVKIYTKIAKPAQAIVVTKTQR